MISCVSIHSTDKLGSQREYLPTWLGRSIIITNWLLWWNWPWRWGESFTIGLSFLLDPPVHLLPLHLLLALSEGGSSLYHLVYQTTKGEPVWTEGVLLIVNDLRSHVADSSNTTTNSFSFRNLNSKPEIRYSRYQNFFIEKVFWKV